MTPMSPWQPTSPTETLRHRAELLALLRRFFDQRGVMEVTTPVLTAGITDVHIDSLCLADAPPNLSQRWLRTSPEYAHKRLLAAGHSDLYELGPVFRAGERGRWHRPEFTLLEWYRVGWTWRQLANEVISLIEHCAALSSRRWTPCWMTYSQAFEQALSIDPVHISDGELRLLTPDLPDHFDHTARLDWLWSSAVQAKLPADQLTVIHHYPASQAALAQLDPEQPHCALRFEVFLGSIELANGYQELTDAQAQGQRFADDNRAREAQGRPSMAVDEAFMAALQHGLPACSGVALGVERLLMALLDIDDISQVMAFADG